MCMRKPIANSTETAFRIDTYLPKAFKMHKLVECIYSVKHRMKWEAATVVYDKVDRHPGCNELIYEYYTCGKNMFGVAARDFHDKGVCLMDGDKYWNYTSTIFHPDENGKLVKSLDRHDKNNVRAVSMCSLLLLERET